jgi:sodium transport system ATP-binding protein
MLATILVPSSGTARVAGHDIIKEAAQVRGSIGYLSGETKLYDRLTGREILQYFGTLAGMAKAAVRARIDELTEPFGLQEILVKRVGRMSTGMKQRLSIARVLFHDPQVLIFDEPTAGLDVIGARTVLDLVLDLKKRGRTIIYSTHIMTEAERICDEIAVIESGDILAQGTLDAIKGQGGHASLEDAFIDMVRKAGAGRGAENGDRAPEARTPVGARS